MEQPPTPHPLCFCCLVAKSSLSLCDPIDFSLPGSSVQGICQARKLQWVPFSSPGHLYDPGIKPAFPALAAGFFTTETPGKTPRPLSEDIFGAIHGECHLPNCVSLMTMCQWHRMEPKPSSTHLLVQCIWWEAEWPMSSRLPASWCPRISSRSFSTSLPPGSTSKLTLAFGVLSLEPSGLKVTLVKALKWKPLSHVWLFATPWTVHGILQATINTGVGSLPLLQGTFPTQGSNPGLPHCRRILYQLSHKRSPKAPKPSYIVVQSCIH